MIRQLPVRRSRRASRVGFTLIEITLVGALMAWLVILLASAWHGLGRPSTDAVVRCRVAGQASLAAASLSRDLGGSLPGALDGKDAGREVGRLLVDGSQLWLCFDGGPVPNGSADWADPDTLIIYSVDEDQLVRTNQSTGSATVVATNVSGLSLVPDALGTKIQLTVTYRDVERTFEMIAVDP